MKTKNLKMFFLTSVVAQCLIIGQTSQAKISDFNEIIGENMKEQKKLKKEITKQLKETHEILDKKAEKVVLSEEGKQEAYNVPTKKSLLRFKKEQASKSRADGREKKQAERIATEMRDDGSL